ncbi:hypothetical protein D3C76_742930 [compost metagenome]
MVQRVGQQAFRRIVGRQQHEHAALEQCREQPGQQHGVADVMHMELVEAQYLAFAQQFIQRRAQGIGACPVAVHALMQAGEEIMKVQAPLGGYRQRLEEAVEQPALAASHRAMQVQAARLALGQLRALFGHAVDDPALAVAEQIAAAARLVFEPAQQFACGRRRGAQPLAELAQGGRDPGGHVEASLGDGRAGRSLHEDGYFDQ